MRKTAVYNKGIKLRKEMKNHVLLLTLALGWNLANAQTPVSETAADTVVSGHKCAQHAPQSRCNRHSHEAQCAQHSREGGCDRRERQCSMVNGQCSMTNVHERQCSMFNG